MIQFLKTKITAYVNILKADSLDLLPMQEIREWYVINSDWNVIAFLTLNWFDKSLASIEEQNIMLIKHLDLLNTRLNWPISYTVIKKKADLIQYRKHFNKFIDKSPSISENSKDLLKTMNWINAINLSESYDIPEKQFIIWVSYEVRVEDKVNLSWKINYNRFNHFTQKQWKKIKEQLDQEVQILVDMLNWWKINLWARMMKEDEIKDYFKNQIDSWLKSKAWKKWKYTL